MKILATSGRWSFAFCARWIHPTPATCIISFVPASFAPSHLSSSFLLYTQGNHMQEQTQSKRPSLQLREKNNNNNHPFLIEDGNCNWIGWWLCRWLVSPISFLWIDNNANKATVCHWWKLNYYCHLFPVCFNFPGYCFGYNNYAFFFSGVAGGTASGKTTVCNMIISRLRDQRVVLVNQVIYYYLLMNYEAIISK